MYSSMTRALLLLLNIYASLPRLAYFLCLAFRTGTSNANSIPTSITCRRFWTFAYVAKRLYTVVPCARRNDAWRHVWLNAIARMVLLIALTCQQTAFLQQQRNAVRETYRHISYTHVRLSAPLPARICAVALLLRAAINVYRCAP